MTSLIHIHLKKGQKIFYYPSSPLCQPCIAIALWSSQPPDALSHLSGVQIWHKSRQMVHFFKDYSCPPSLCVVQGVQWAEQKRALLWQDGSERVTGFQAGDDRLSLGGGREEQLAPLLHFWLTYSYGRRARRKFPPYCAHSHIFSCYIVSMSFEQFNYPYTLSQRLEMFRLLLYLESHI